MIMFLLGAIFATLLIYGIHTVRWYIRWRKFLDAAMAENLEWCERHNRENKRSA